MTFRHLKANRYIRSLINAVMLLVLGMFIGAAVMVTIGANPIVAYSALLDSAFGSPAGITNVLTRCVPLVLTGLSLATSYYAGIFNLGGEGQLYMGAFAAAVVGFMMGPLDKAIHVPLALLASAFVTAEIL